jgi:hypothetical protein
MRFHLKSLSVLYEGKILMKNVLKEKMLSGERTLGTFLKPAAPRLHNVLVLRDWITSSSIMSTGRLIRSPLWSMSALRSSMG